MPNGGAVPVMLVATEWLGWALSRRSLPIACRMAASLNRPLILFRRPLWESAEKLLLKVRETAFYSAPLWLQSVRPSLAGLVHKITCYDLGAAGGAGGSSKATTPSSTPAARRGTPSSPKSAASPPSQPEPGPRSISDFARWYKTVVWLYPISGGRVHRTDRSCRAQRDLQSAAHSDLQRCVVLGVASESKSFRTMIDTVGGSRLPARAAPDAAMPSWVVGGTDQGQTREAKPSPSASCGAGSWELGSGDIRCHVDHRRRTPRSPRLDPNLIGDAAGFSREWFKVPGARRGSCGNCHRRTGHGGR